MVTAAQRAAKEALEKAEEAVSEEERQAGLPRAVVEKAGEGLTETDGTIHRVKLDDPFPKSLVGLLPRTSKRPAMEYVGHGAVTRRLLDVDPNWTWEPMGYGPDGTAAVERDQHGRPVGLWIKLTVNGVTRPGYGDCESGQFSAMKVLIGDALRNAAMRFGVALDLWVRGQAEDDEQFQGVTEEPPAPVDPVVEENMERYRAIMNRAMDLKAKDEAHIVGLRARATAAGFASVNDWGKAHVDDFEEAVAGLEAVVAQEASGEPEREGTDG